MIVPIANYPTSSDYHKLWELAHHASIVCIVDHEPGKPGTCVSTPSPKTGLMAVMQHELSRRALSRAGRAMGTNRAMARLQSDLAQIEQLADPIPAPPVLVIDEVLPSPSPSAAIPRFAQLSCLRRHRPR
jgi:hypothetical protein